MAGIPVTDIGSMMNMPFVAGNTPVSVSKNTAPGQTSFEDIWNSQAQTRSNLQPQMKDSRLDNADASKQENVQKSSDVREPQTRQSDRTTAKEPTEAKGVQEKQTRTEETGSVEERKDEPEKLDEIMEVLGTAAMELVGLVADNFDISAEEVQEDMSALGMQPLEILQDEGLGRLLLEVGGAEDVSALLTDEQLYQDYKTLMSSQEELMESTEEALQELYADGTMPDVETLVQRAVEVQRTPVEAADAMPLQEEPMITVEVARNADEDVEEAIAEPVAEPFPMTDETPEAQAQSQNAGHAGNHTGERHERNERVQPQPVHPMFGEFQTQEPQLQPEMVAETTSAWDADTQNIMRQVLDYMRVQIRPDASQLEMQLHPASLGSIQIQVASRGGVLTAQFFTQDESVKAVLESQMVQLKESFAEQGVTVENIEVNVQTQQFERNMEQGQNGQQGEPAGRGRTRRIRLDGNMSPEELDAMLDDLEEDQRLAADMMAANGNSVDYTA